MTIRVLIADDHAQFRAMVAELLEEAGFDVCAQAATGDDAAKKAIEHRPDVALLDIRMPRDGISAARRIAAALPDTRILMLTVSADSDDVLDALHAGAQGYVLKGATPEEIIDAVRAVHEGAAVLAPAVAPTVLREIRRTRDRHLRIAAGTSVPLTEREWKILQLLDEGETTTAIASALFVAPVTVRSHNLALNRKLEVRNRADAVTLFRSQRPGRARAAASSVETKPTLPAER
jgi:DNA-binding NarL/FixJ family response regulator